MTSVAQNKNTPITGSRRVGDHRMQERYQMASFGAGQRAHSTERSAELRRATLLYVSAANSSVERCFQFTTSSYQREQNHALYIPRSSIDARTKVVTSVIRREEQMARNAEVGQKQITKKELDRGSTRRLMYCTNSLLVALFNIYSYVTLFLYAVSRVK